ncbi:MAG: hypothetical protein BroJett003_26290 [Planctomycetota bacterium]|nr:MAG: hypothetical protein BroJett003_26290 [Planctomycetota bacterium]
MRCKQCEYRLWNLRSRNCPECGAPFSPRDYTFVPNAVRFLCPHCDQAYYGTDEKGHLVPSSFQCVACRASIDLGEMVLQPAEGMEEDATQPSPVPWLERAKLGAWRGWWRTVGWTISSPRKLASRLPAVPRKGDAWIFLILNTVVAALGMIFPFGLTLLMTGGMMGGTPGAPGVGMLGAVYGMMIVMMIPATLLSTFLWAACTHGVLRLGAKPRGDFGMTQEAICYSSGISTLNAVPCIGPYVAPFWSIITAIILLKERQRIGGWRASVAVLAFPVVICGGVVALYAVMLALAINMAGTIGPGGAVAQGYAAGIGTAVTSYADQNRGVWPKHAGELLLPGASTLTSGLFVLPDSATTTADAFIGTVSLDAFEGLDETQMRQVVDAAILALPPDVTAHRVGDYVFTYHSVDSANALGRLWIVVCSADPDVNAGASSQGVTVVMKSGRVKYIDPADWATELAKQNGLRAAAGLAPLPNPWTVTHANPSRAATAPGTADAPEGDAAEGDADAETGPEESSPPP